MSEGYMAMCLSCGSRPRSGGTGFCYNCRMKMGVTRDSDVCSVCLGRKTVVLLHGDGNTEKKTCTACKGTGKKGK